MGLLNLDSRGGRISLNTNSLKMAFKTSCLSDKWIHVINLKFKSNHSYQCSLSLDFVSFSGLRGVTGGTVISLKYNCLLRVYYSLLFRAVYIRSGSAFVNSVNSSILCFVKLLVIKLENQCFAEKLILHGIMLWLFPHVVSQRYCLEAAKGLVRTEIMS